MQETCHLPCQATILVVDKRIEQARGAVQGDYIIVSYCSRNQATMPLREFHLVVDATHLKAAITLYAHGDDKAVVLQQVAMEGDLRLYHPYAEIGRINHQIGIPLLVRVNRAVFLLHMEVQRFSRQLGMQFTRFAVYARTIIVKDTVGDV